MTMSDPLFNISYFKKTIYELRRLATNNNTAASLVLGIMYFHGIFIDRDNTKAFEYFYEVVNSGQGDAYSYLLLGNCYLTGIGTDIDHEKAFKHYKHITKGSKFMSDPNSMYAVYNYALCYENGYGVKKNEKKALELYQDLYKKENAQKFDLLNYKLGEIYFNRAKNISDYSRACIYLIESATQGCIKANVKLGTIFDYGHGLKSDISKAYTYYKNAQILSNGNTPFMGYLNESSVSWGKYLNKTKEQLELTLNYDKNNILIEYLLSALYYNCNDYERLLPLLKKLATEDFSQAQYQLAHLIDLGIYEETEEFNMYELYKKAAEKKHEQALLKTIELLKHDNNELEILFKQAIELKIEKGIYILSIFYYLGLNTNKDYIKSFLGFSSISSYNMNYVRLQLSLCHFLGYGVEKDNSKAFNYAYRVKNNFLYAKILCAYIQEEYEIQTDYYFDIEEVLSNDENISAINYIKAKIYDKQSKFKSAEKVWLMCLDDARYNIANDRVKNPYNEMLENNFNEAVKRALKIPEDIKQTAMFNLGCYYYYGAASNIEENDIESNLEKAEFYLQQVTGNDEAQYILGLKYYHEDIDKAVKCYKASLNKSQTLKNILEYISLKREYSEEYTEILEKLSNNNNSIALFLKGFEMETLIKLEEAIRYYKKSISAWLDNKNNNIDAYRISIATIKDKAESSYKLAYCFEYGIGVDVNKKEALHYYNISADAGYIPAKLTIAKSLSGENMFDSLEKAYNIYEELANQGVAEAVYMMGYFYENGLNTKVDMDYAKRCYIYAASKGYREAIYRLNEIQ